MKLQKKLNLNSIIITLIHSILNQIRKYYRELLILEEKNAIEFVELSILTNEKCKSEENRNDE